MQIYEISALDGADVAGGPITTSHFGGEVTGLARHPQRAEFATAGDDGSVNGLVDFLVQLLNFLSVISWLRCFALASF